MQVKYRFILSGVLIELCKKSEYIHESPSHTTEKI